MPSTVPLRPATTKSKKSGKAPASATQTTWSHEFDTLRRENLFRNPPTDHSAYPLLTQAIAPHIESFNAVFEEGGLISHALKDIGTKTFLDGDERAGPAGKNQLHVRIKQVFLEKTKLPDQNKFTDLYNRKIMPAECRERHSTYRGKLSVMVEYRINDGDPQTFLQGLGAVPIMLMVILLLNLCVIQR